MNFGHNHSRIINIAIKLGYETAREFAEFLKKYNPEIVKTKSGREIFQLSLFA